MTCFSETFCGCLKIPRPKLPKSFNQISNYLSLVDLFDRLSSIVPTSVILSLTNIVLDVKDFISAMFLDNQFPQRAWGHDLRSIRVLQMMHHRTWFLNHWELYNASKKRICPFKLWALFKNISHLRHRHEGLILMFKICKKFWSLFNLLGQYSENI